MITLLNGTREKSRLGTIVKISSSKEGVFVYASNDEKGNIGVVGEDNILPNKPCGVIYQGTAKVLVRGSVKAGDIIRSRISSDKFIQGASFVATTSNFGYTQIGTAISNGRNALIDVTLDIKYISGSVQHPDTNATTVITDTYTIINSDYMVICNKGSAMNVNLPKATGGNRKLEIKNIGAGTVTVDGNGDETIDGDATYDMIQWESINLKDYITGKWIIF